MLFPIYSFKFNHSILPNLVAIGKFDGTNCSLALGTAGGKVLLHCPGLSNNLSSTPRSLSGVAADVNLLNISQPINCLKAASFTHDRDVLFIGMQTELLLFDVHDNKDIFYKDVVDGIECLAIGNLTGPGTESFAGERLVFCGGQCTIQGINFESEELFWTVTGDNVSSMLLCDYFNSGRNQLIVGSEDYDIRVFDGDEIISEMKETAVVNGLCALSEGKFAYSLTNGTVGVYDKITRLWRIKSKNMPVCIFPYDINGDGVPELITGWSSGKIDARLESTGEVVFKDNFSSSVAGIISGDYSNSGQQELICISVDGEVKGYVPSKTGEKVISDVSIGAESYRDLLIKKQNMTAELKNYVESSKAAIKIKSGQKDASNYSAIPSNTKLQTSLVPALCDVSPSITGCVEVHLSTSNESIIRAVIIFAEGMFEGESYVVHPHASSLSKNALVHLLPPVNMIYDLHFKVLVGSRGTQQFHVFELCQQLPTFSMFLFDPPNFEDPNGYVVITINERINRILMWAQNNFLFPTSVVLDNCKDLKFLCLRSGEFLRFSVSQDNTSLQITIKTNDIDLAGDIIQSLMTYINQLEFNSVAHFQPVYDELVELLKKVDEFYEIRARLSSEVADHSNLLKGLVVRAEDSRLINDWKSMKKSYDELYTINDDLINKFKIRTTNQFELMNFLKILNQIIQRTSNLRGGKYKTEIVTAGRQTIKDMQSKNFQQYLVSTSES